MRGPIYKYKCYKYITVRKNSSPNKFFYDFQLTSVKKRNTWPKTPGWGILIESFKYIDFAMDFIAEKLAVSLRRQQSN